MQKPSRRRFLIGSAVTTTALAGCLDDDAEPAATGTEPSDEDPEEPPEEAADGAAEELPEALANALQALPSREAITFEYQTVMAIDLRAADGRDEIPPDAGLVAEIDDVALDDVAYLVMARSMDHGNVLGSLVGEFEKPEPGTETESDGVWRIADDGEIGFASDDGRLVFAGEDSEPQTEWAATAAEAAEGETERFIDSVDEFPAAFVRFDDSEFAVFAPTVDEDLFPDIDHEKLRSIAAGFQTHPAHQDGRLDNEYLLYPADGASIDDEDVGELLDEIEVGEVVETEIERGEAIHVEAVIEQPLSRDREAAPDAEFRSSVDSTAGVVELQHRSGDIVEADELDLWVDGQLADRQPADIHDEIAAGDVIEVDAEPLTGIVLRWIDEDQRVEHVYERLLVGEDAITARYVSEADAVQFTYEGDRPVDTDKLAVIHRGTDSQSSEPVEQTELETGDTITVENVAVGETVVLELDVPEEPRGRSWTVARVRVSEPHVHPHQTDDGVAITYHDPQQRQGNELRILVDGEPAATQFGDVHDSLTSGDSVTLEGVETGSTVVVEWIEPEEPTEIGELLVIPQADIGLEYRSDGTVIAEHEGGDPIEAEDLVLRTGSEEVPFDAEDDRFERDDTFETTAEPFVAVTVKWTGYDDDGGAPEEASEDPRRRRSRTQLSRLVTGQGLIESAYDPDTETVELIYVGEQPADPDRLRIRLGGADGVTQFEDEYDTLTAGDSVVVDGIDTNTLQVGLSDDAVRQSLVRFRPRPRFAFEFERRDGGVVLVYSNDTDRHAEGFRVLADGEPIDRQPADEHDELSAGDELAIGEFGAGTELSVEWTVPDDPVEVEEHVVVPEATFEAEYDGSDGTVTVEHVGGDELAADSVGYLVEPVDNDLVDWGDTGTIAPGHSITTTVDSEPRRVFVVYKERELLGEIEFEQS